jgi:hypothetical protein
MIVGPSPCSLCGDPIPNKPDDVEDSHTDEHTPPKQFYPKSVRTEPRDRLWKVPSHRRCNSAYKLDEEYFYHYFYPLVSVRNEQMGAILLHDLKRRAQKPQSKGLIRRLLKDCTNETPGGIVLPPTLVRVNYDIVRIQRVAIKIAQCLFCKDYGRFMPKLNCKDIRLCETEPEVPEFYSLLWQIETKKAVVPSVFCYWHAELDGMYLYSMLFWEAFMFCLTFQEPAESKKALAPASTAGIF